MLTAVKSNLKIAFLSFKYNVMKSMVNKTAFIMNVLFMILNNSTFIIEWLVIFNLKEDVCGYQLNDILKLWAISASSYGIAHMLFAGVFELNETITNGLLDTFLVQPKSVLLLAATSKTTVSAIGDFIYGLIIMLFLKSNILEILMFVILSICGGIIFSAFTAIVNSIAFVIPRSDGLSNSLVSILVSVSTYPEEIFKEGVRLFLYLVIPVGASIYIPFKILSLFNIKLLVIVFICTIFYTWLAFFVFNKGLKKYSSTNLMTPRT